MTVEPEDAEEVVERLEALESFGHLRARKWGKSIVIFSGDGPTRQNHARFTLVAPDT